MATITISDIQGSPLALVKVQLDANNSYEIYIPKQIADQITALNSSAIEDRKSADRVIVTK
jgi:hypothetical protein